MMGGEPTTLGSDRMDFMCFRCWKILKGEAIRIPKAYSIDSGKKKLAVNLFVL